MSACLRRSPWFWLAIAAVAGLLLFTGGFATWKLAIAPAFSRWGQSQLPPGFPVYPGASLTGASVAISDCTYVEVDWQTDSTAAAVLSFYHDRMTQAPWRLVETGEPRTVAFVGSGRDEVFGRIQVANGGPPTQFRYLGQRPYDALGQFQPFCLTPNPRQRRPSPQAA